MRHQRQDEDSTIKYKQSAHEHVQCARQMQSDQHAPRERKEKVSHRPPTLSHHADCRVAALGCTAYRRTEIAGIQHTTQHACNLSMLFSITLVPDSKKKHAQASCREMIHTWLLPPGLLHLPRFMNTCLTHGHHFWFRLSCK